MDRQDAIDRLLDHYEHPRNQGPLDSADVVQPGGQPDCGDQVTIYLRVDPSHSQIERITFEGQGCTVSQAAASILTEFAAGRPVDAIEQFDDNAMLDLLGREVVRTRTRCATLALTTLKAALARYRREHRS